MSSRGYDGAWQKSSEVKYKVRSTNVVRPELVITLMRTIISTFFSRYSIDSPGRINAGGRSGRGNGRMLARRADVNVSVPIGKEMKQI